MNRRLLKSWFFWVKSSFEMIVTQLGLLFVQGHYLRLSNAQFSHNFYVAWHFPHTPAHFLFTYFPGNSGQYRLQKFVGVHKKMCQLGPPHKKVSPANKKLTYHSALWSHSGNHVWSLPSIFPNNIWPSFLMQDLYLSKKFCD